MTNNNIYELPKTATISYFNEAEWNKDLTVEEVLKSNELGELEYQDKLLHDPQYGPGGSNSKEATKTVMSGLLAVSYAIPVLAPVGIAVSVGVGVTGLAMRELSDDPEVKQAGQEMLEVVANSADPDIRDGASYATNSVNVYNQLSKR